MADYSSLVQNDYVKNNENVEKFPYKILNDLAAKLKAAEDKIIQDKKHYEAKIADLLDEIESSCDASKDMLKEDDAITKFKQRISDLVYENNRYHLAISNCTFCASDKSDSPDASTFFEASIRASTPLPSLDLSPASLSSTILALMSINWDRKQANTEQKSNTGPSSTGWLRLSPSWRRSTRPLSTRGRKDCSQGRGLAP